MEQARTVVPREAKPITFIDNGRATRRKRLKKAGHLGKRKRLRLRK